MVKEQGQTQNRSQQPNTTVQQNIPPPPGTPGTGTENNENNQRREELTNFEISTRQSQTVRDAYSVENLSIAVLCEQGAPHRHQGRHPAEDPDLRDRAARLLGGAGFDKERGDKLKVVACPSRTRGNNMEPIPAARYWCPSCCSVRPAPS